MPGARATGGSLQLVSIRLAQRDEHKSLRRIATMTHNPSVPGSSPGGPTNLRRASYRPTWFPTCDALRRIGQPEREPVRVAGAYEAGGRGDREGDRNSAHASTST